MIKRQFLVTVFILATVLTPHSIQAKPGLEAAIAVLSATSSSNVTGTVRFSSVKNGVRVIADANGLTPGKHGFHIHEFGDISASDGSSVGGHFNPHNHSHGDPSSSKHTHHAGDLGNLVADSKGVAHLDVILPLTTQHIIGRSVVVHAKEDDFTTQPTGASGARVACGVIGIAKQPQ